MNKLFAAVFACFATVSFAQTPPSVPKEDPNKPAPKVEVKKPVEVKKEEPKKVEAKKEEPKKVEPAKVEPKKEEPKKDPAKK